MKKYRYLARLREVNRYSLKVLASKVGISKQYLWDIEDGRKILSYKMAYKLSKILEVKPDEIFLEDHKKEPSKR